MSLVFVTFISTFVKGQTSNVQLFHLDKAPNDTIHTKDINKSLELKSDEISRTVASFDLEITYTTYVYTENSTTNRITRNMVDIMKYLKGANNYFTIKKIIASENGTTTTYEGFKVYVID